MKIILTGIIERAEIIADRATSIDVKADGSKELKTIEVPVKFNPETLAGQRCYYEADNQGNKYKFQADRAVGSTVVEWSYNGKPRMTFPPSKVA